jgi:hypothetical protein
MGNLRLAVLGLVAALVSIGCMGNREPQRVAYIVEVVEETIPSPRFVGHWENEQLGGSSVRVGPGWETAEDALAWARARAPVVIVRTGTATGMARSWSAGARVVERYGEDVLDPWPGIGALADVKQIPNYGGAAFVAEQPPRKYALAGTYRLHFANGEDLAHFDSVTEGSGAEYPHLESALDVARRSASIVLLQIGAPPHELYSAGDEDSSLGLKRWSTGEWTNKPKA